MATFAEGSRNSLNDSLELPSLTFKGLETGRHSNDSFESFDDVSSEQPLISPTKKKPSSRIHVHEVPNQIGSDAPIRFPRISLPVQMMRNSYDVVVIGTGYGGSVAASRFARARQRVCVLERGKERWPGEFPETAKATARELRVTGEWAPGDRRGRQGKLVDTDAGNATGLYHLAVGDGQHVVSGNGLGGGSLVNAGVFMKPTLTVLDMEFWPEELRGEDKWTKYYNRATDVLEPVEYPPTHPKLLKAEFLRNQARLMGQEQNFYQVKQTTRFHDGPNSTGVHMRASQLTGMDATGLNDGSKSSTLVNYLSDAWNWGAEMFCECEVRHVVKAPGRKGYIVYFVWHSEDRSRFKSFRDDLMWVHAEKLVVFGAGSLGTTEILLRSKQMGLSMSGTLGTEMSGNGDMLGFGYNTNHEVNCVGNPTPKPEHPVGPCITSVIDMRDQTNPLEGFMVQDCAVPRAIASLMFPMLKFMPGPSKSGRSPALKLGAKIVRSPFSGGSSRRTATYLVMSHDSSQGRLTLKDDKPVLTYPGVGRSATASRNHAFLESMTAAVGGEYVACPFWTLLGSQQVTVHPIGGARVSSDGTGKKGATNHMGEVFTGEGAETHPGLLVCDGAAVPASLGVNPFATITAFAERSVELAADKFGLLIDYETRNGNLDLFGKPAHPMPQDTNLMELSSTISRSKKEETSGIGFSEVMSGFVYTGSDVEDFRVATDLARSRCETARFFLTVNSYDISELIKNELQAANLTGTFSCSSLGGIFTVQRGTLRLFNQDPRQSETSNLTYDFDMVNPQGRKLHFYGYKIINAASFLRPGNIWKQTTKLFVVITDADTKSVVGRGTLYIRVSDFCKEMRTFSATNSSLRRRVSTKMSFANFFAKKLAVHFFSTLGRLQYPIEGSLEEIQPSQIIALEARDGIKTPLRMWEPLGQDHAQISSPPSILFVPGAAVDHKIFATPTIPTNTITYFRKLGYRIYCLTFRLGIGPTAELGHTAYDARLDIAAALEHIREVSLQENPDDPQKPYVVAHCVGSLAFGCGLLDGTIPGKDWIQGATCSAVFMNPKFGPINQIMSHFPVGVYSSLVSPMFDCRSSRDDTLIQRAINQGLRFYPVGGHGETCRSIACHRTEFVFSRLWNHENLNEETHKNIDKYFGASHMNTMSWLMECGQLGTLTTNAPSHTNLATPEGIERLKGLPILFVTGADNMAYTAETMDISYTTLCHAHGRQWYQREVFPNMGHLDVWMGTKSSEIVYPRVRRHVEEVMGLP